jgi:hypothetical protein
VGFVSAFSGQIVNLTPPALSDDTTLHARINGPKDPHWTLRGPAPSCSGSREGGDESMRPTEEAAGGTENSVYRFLMADSSHADIRLAFGPQKTLLKTCGAR